MLFAGALMGMLLMGSFLGLDLLTHMVLIFFQFPFGVEYVHQKGLKALAYFLKTLTL